MMNRYQPLLLLLIALCFCLPEASAQPADVRFEDETIPSGTYEATVSVSARNATITSTSQVTFRAGQTVRLEAGFKIEAGATFRAEVDPSVGSGGGSGPIVLDDVPPNERPGRFFPDQFDVHRPALSLRGFDSAAFAEGDDFGYGLKQVLEIAYDEANPEAALVRSVYREIVETSNAELLDPQNPPAGKGARTVINENTAVMQARAFVALATYVLEQNGNSNASYQINPNPSNPDPKQA